MSALSSEIALDETLLRDNRLVLRSFQNSDQSAALKLLHTGLLAGHIDPLDAANELARTEGEYLFRAQDHFWVAEVNASVIGTIALAVDRLGVAHVRRLRVAAWNASYSAPRFLVPTRSSLARKSCSMSRIIWWGRD